MKMRIIFTLLFFSLPYLSSWATDEEKIVASAEKVVHAWEKVFAKEVDVLYRMEKGCWGVRRHKLVDGSTSYDVKKTDSIVSPYKLIINFKAIYFDNCFSPNADGCHDPKVLAQTYGFRNAEAALKNTNPPDFPPSSYGGKSERTIITVEAFYAYQKGGWVLKGGNPYFMNQFQKNFEYKENDRYFQNLLSMPAK